LLLLKIEMKIVLALFLYFAFLCVVRAEYEPTKDIEEGVQKMLLNLINNEKKNECAENVESFRSVWRFLPEELKESIVQEVARQIWSQVFNLIILVSRNSKTVNKFSLILE
jgi:hypothetical protein